MVAKKFGDKKYTGKECSTCGTNERYVNAGCVRCDQVRKLKQRRRTPTHSFERMRRVKHSSEWIEMVFGDDAETMIARYLRQAETVSGVKPDPKEVYVTAGTCAENHPPVRYITSGKCFVCEEQRRLYARVANWENKAIEEEVAPDYWATTGWGNDPDRPKTLPEHLYCGKPCKKGHPGMRYKSTKGCWHCLQARDQRKQKVIEAPLMVCALLA